MMPKMPNSPPRMVFQKFWPGTSTIATQRSPNPASRTLGSRLGVSARRCARRDGVFLPREADERVPVLREREEELRPVEDFRLLLLFPERDCAIVRSTFLIETLYINGLISPTGIRILFYHEWRGL